MLLILDTASILKNAAARLALFVLAVTFLGCQSKKSAAPVVKDAIYYSPQYSAQDIENFDKHFNKSELDCQDNQNCPENVAMISFAVEDKLAQCTGTLVGPKLILTNSHCISEKVKKNPDQCALLGATFRLQDGSLYRAKCEKVLSQTNSTQDRLQTPDLALIQLKESPPITPAQISRKGVIENHPYSFYAVDPILPKSNEKDIIHPRGIIVNKTGSSSYFSALTPFYSHRFSAVVNFFIKDEKALIAGNSGSSLRNESGEIIAVMQASLEDSSTAKDLRMSSGFSIGTNVSCISSPSLTQDLPSICSKISTDIPPMSLTTPKAEVVAKLFTEKINRKRVLGYTLAYAVNSSPKVPEAKLNEPNETDLNYAFEFKSVLPCMTQVQKLEPGKTYPAEMFDGVWPVQLDERWVPEWEAKNKATSTLYINQVTQEKLEVPSSGVLQRGDKQQNLSLCSQQNDFIKLEPLVKAFNQ